MAKRDVQLVIKARSEADRAIDSISSAMRTLLGVQNELSGSGERTSNTLERMAGAFNNIDAAFSKVEQSVASGRRTLASQESALAENESRYASLRREIAAAEQAIINTRIAMQTDGSEQLAVKLASAQQGYRALTGEANRLENRITSQRTEVVAASGAYDQLENAATAAQIAMGKMGDAGERENLRIAAAAKEAEFALRAKAAAAEQDAQRASMAEAALRARGRRDGNGGEVPVARDTALAETLRLEEATEEAARAEKALADAATMSEAALRARARAAQGGESGLKAADTALAGALREEEAAAQAAARASDELSAAADRLRARARPAAVAQERINAEMKEARMLYAAGKISIRDLTAELDRLESQLKQVDTAQGRMNRNGSNEIKGVLGLRPYELQNLSYQINDLFTQIASGAPVSQAFAQQGGQILQIFPQVLSFFLKYAKGLGLVAVALTPVIIGMGRLNELAELQKDFDANLRLSADGAAYNTEALIANVEALDRYGVSFEDATEAVKTFLSESVRPEMLDQMGQAAKNLADITGIELKDAAEQVAEAFTGGYEAIADFDDKMNFLTLTEREQIRAMFDSGEASDARALAFARFFDQAEEGARSTETAWSRMTDAMANAWTDFENFLAGTTVFANLRSEMNDLAVGATYLINRVRGLSHETAALDALGKQRVGGDGSPAFLAKYDALGNRVDPLDTSSNRERKLASDAAYDEAKKKKKKGRSGKSDAEYQADLNREIERANREREIQAEQTGRTNVLTGEALILEKRRQAIADAIRQVENKATKDGKRRLSITEAQRAEIARTVGLEFDAKNAKALAQAEQKEHEQAINDLMARRREMLEAMEFASPGTDRFEQLQTAVLGINLQLEKATDGAEGFWKKLAGDPERMALLGYTKDQVAAIVAELENAQRAIRRDTLEAAQARAESGLNELRNMRDLLQEQIEFAQLQGEVGRAGMLQERLVEVNEKLREGAQVAIEYWRALRGNPDDLALLGLTPEAVDNIIMGLENTIAAAERLRTQFLKTGEALNRDLAAGGANAMEQFAQSIVKGENVLESFAQAFLQFAADFLLQIARMIAQQAIFNALSGGSPGGAGGAGGGIAGLIGGLFHGGGVVGGTGARGRPVSSAIFANATRYHGGGIAGLKPDEVPAILQRGEEVLTRADARHRANGGGAKGGRGLSQVLAIGEEAIARAIAGSAGREVVLTHIREDRATIRKELGID